MEDQCTNTLFMVKPVDFGFNRQAAETNAFMEDIETSRDPQKNALQNFDAFVRLLRKNEVNVFVFEDTAEPFTPDSIFPNNWVSFHADGHVCLYPMEVENRRFERRSDLIQELGKTFYISKISDLSPLEKENCFLEGTGSLVLDRVHKKAYACLSARTHERGLHEWNQLFPDYDVISFEAVDRSGLPIYHTNVLMSVGVNHAVVCLEAVKDATRLLKNLKETGKEVIVITYEQMEQFAGNMLQIENKKGERLNVMSSKAYYSLTDQQRKQLTSHGRILYSELGLIETLGGGSARCMIAEIHLPQNK